MDKANNFTHLIAWICCIFKSDKECRYGIYISDVIKFSIGMRVLNSYPITHKCEMTANYKIVQVCSHNAISIKRVAYDSDCRVLTVL